MGLRDLAHDISKTCVPLKSADEEGSLYGREADRVDRSRTFAAGRIEWIETVELVEKSTGIPAKVIADDIDTHLLVFADRRCEIAEHAA